MENLAQLLHEYMEAHHRGQKNAIPRELLLRGYVWPLDNTIDDRGFRKLYGQLPVAGCARGLFIPATPFELKEFKAYLLKKGMSTDRAWARVKIILTYGGILWIQASGSSGIKKRVDEFKKYFQFLLPGEHLQLWTKTGTTWNVKEIPIREGAEPLELGKIIRRKWYSASGWEF